MSALTSAMTAQTSMARIPETKGAAPSEVQMLRYAGVRYERYDRVAANGLPAEHRYSAYAARDERRISQHGNLLIQADRLRFVPKSGKAESDAAQTENITRYETVATSDVRLQKIVADTMTFGYADAKQSTGLHSSSPGDGIDWKREVTAYDAPILVWTSSDAAGVRNPIARSVKTSTAEQSESLDEPDGTASLRIDDDGSVHENWHDGPGQSSFDQKPDGEAETMYQTVGFSSSQTTISAPFLSKGGYAIKIGDESSGRTVGNDQPVSKTQYEARDWYPGGAAIPKEQDTINSGEGAILAICGKGWAGRRARIVTERRTWTHADGGAEADVRTSFGSEPNVICEIEQKKHEAYNIGNGQLFATSVTTTILRLAGSGIELSGRI